MSKRKTKKYHKKRNTYNRKNTKRKNTKRKNTYKRKRKRTNRKKLTGGIAVRNAVKSLFEKKPKREQQEYFNKLYKTHNHSIQQSNISSLDYLNNAFMKGESLHIFSGSDGKPKGIYTQASFDTLKRACGADCQEKEQLPAPLAAPVAAPAATPVVADTQLLQNIESRLKSLELKLGDNVSKSDLEDLRGKFVLTLNKLNSVLFAEINKIKGEINNIKGEINNIKAVLEEHSDKMLHPQEKSKLNEYFQRLNKNLEELKNKQAKLETSLRSLENSQSLTETNPTSVLGKNEDLINLFQEPTSQSLTQVAQPVAQQPVAQQQVAQQPVVPQPVAQPVAQQVAQQPVVPQPVAGSGTLMDLSFMNNNNNKSMGKADYDQLNEIIDKNKIN